MSEGAVISYTDEDTGTVFRWHGGAYIDVGYYPYDHEGRVLLTSDNVPDFSAQDVINVWDDEGDLSYLEAEVANRTFPPRRPFRAILEAFEARCQEYLKQEQESDEEA